MKTDKQIFTDQDFKNLCDYVIKRLSEERQKRNLRTVARRLGNENLQGLLSNIISRRREIPIDRIFELVKILKAMEP